MTTLHTDPAPPFTEIVTLAQDGEQRSLGARTITGAFAVGSVALLILALQPILLGALVERGVLSDRQLGWAATVEVLTLALLSAVSPALVRGGRGRVWCCGAALGLAALDYLTGGAANLMQVLLLRGAAGALEGLMLGITIVVMLNGRSPDRLNALFLGFSAIPQAAGAFLLSAWLIPAGGVKLGFTVLALTALVGGLACFLVPERVGIAHGADVKPFAPSLAILAVFTGIFLQNAAIGSAWSYIERLAQNDGFSAATVAFAIAGNVGFQVAGAMLTAWLGGRAPFRWALVLGAISQAAILAWLVTTHTASGYVIAAFAFGLLWLAMSPFQLRLLLALDDTRVAASWSVAVTLLGLSFGPFAGAISVSDHSVVGAFWTATAMLGACIPFYVFARRRNSPPSEALQER